jgi:hypothetical protein
MYQPCINASIRYKLEIIYVLKDGIWSVLIACKSSVVPMHAMKTQKSAGTTTLIVNFHPGPRGVVRQYSTHNSCFTLAFAWGKNHIKPQ